MSDATLPTKPGIYYGVPFADYIKIRAINSSKLKLAKRSMAHVRYAIDEPDTDSAAKSFGRLIHTVLLEPERLESVIAPPINPRTGLAFGPETKAFADFAAANPRAMIASQEDIDHAVRIVQKVAAHPYAGPVLDYVRSSKGAGRRAVEATILWERHGVLCKARVDVIRPPEFWADIKTTDDARPHAFSRSIDLYGYDLQWAMYEDAIRTLGGPPMEFSWIAIETSGSAEVMVHEPSEDLKEIARATFEIAIKRYAECVTSGVWPGYAPDVNVIDLPMWRSNELLQHG